MQTQTQSRVGLLLRDSPAMGLAEARRPAGATNDLAKRHDEATAEVEATAAMAAGSRRCAWLGLASVVELAGGLLRRWQCEADGVHEPVKCEGGMLATFSGSKHASSQLRCNWVGVDRVSLGLSQWLLASRFLEFLYRDSIHLRASPSPPGPSAGLGAFFAVASRPP